MKQSLLKIIKSLQGNVFTLGIVDEDLISAVQNNNNIDHFLMLNINQTIEYSKSTKYKPTKKIKIKKIRKTNKKKKIDYSICEISDCKEHFRTFINDTIYFNKKKIYYYGKIFEYDLDDLIKKYRRYIVEIKITKYKNDDFILEIDTSKAKTNKLKGTFYRIIDFFTMVFDCFADFLLS